MIRTFKYRLKNTNGLAEMAGAVNFVWNYCNQAAVEYLMKWDVWLSRFDYHPLTVGCSKELGLTCSSIELVAVIVLHQPDGTVTRIAEVFDSMSGATAADVLVQNANDYRRNFGVAVGGETTKSHKSEGICTCGTDRIGSTKLWCCNQCGKRHEEFYKGEFSELSGEPKTLPTDQEIEAEISRRFADQATFTRKGFEMGARWARDFRRF